MKFETLCDTNQGSSNGIQVSEPMILTITGSALFTKRNLPFIEYSVLETLGHTLTKIKLNEPGNSTFIQLHRKCLVKSTKHRQ